MARKINNIENANKFVNKCDVKTIITFRTQQLYDLWVNEMSGQISDGMWENSSRTEWIWRDAMLRLGSETKVEVYNKWTIGRKSFGMNGELWSVIGDRIMDENGFATEKEAKAAWREIAQAIANATESSEVGAIREEAQKAKTDNMKSQMKDLLDEWEQVTGKRPVDESIYTFVSYQFNEHDVTYLDGHVSVQRSYLFLHISSDKEGNLKHQIDYHDSRWYVPTGKLAEAIEAIKEFDNKMCF